MKSSKNTLILKLTFLLSLYFSLGTMAQTSETFAFAKGADIGWLSQMEATGYKFYENDGKETPCLDLLKAREINTIRLRVFVNPSDHKSDGHCSKEETVAMAVRAKAMGMRVMIDFHYSDIWADPAHQTKPAAWASHPFAELLDDVYNHTYDVLNALKTAGVTPEWVQVGNEIPGGMLWPEGRTSNWSQLAQLLNKGYDATKAIAPSIKVVVHIDRGNDNARCRNFYDKAKANNVKYDVIGLSYYPYWLGSDYSATIADLQSNLKDMAVRYEKEVMIVEVGGDYTLVQNTKDMLSAVIAAVKSVPDEKGLGVIYWEPEGAKSWSGYQLSAWLDNGKPSPALDAFMESNNVEIEQVAVNGFVANPVEQGKSFTANLTYTANTATNYFYVGLFKRNASGTWMQTVVESAGNQFLVPSTGVDIQTQVALNIPSVTIPSADLKNGEYYDVDVQLWTAGWGAKLSSSLSPKLNIVTAGTLGTNNNLEKKFVLYPNPVANILNFSVPNNTTIKSLRIINVLGETVYANTNVASQNSIDVSHLSSGLYIVSVNLDGNTQQYKFQKK